MKHNKEPKLSLLLAPVHPLDGEEWEGQPEGGGVCKVVGGG